MRELIKLLKEVRDSPPLGEMSNAVVVSGKTWQQIVEALRRLNHDIRTKA